MITSVGSDPRRRPSTEEALHVLEQFSDAANMHFDRITAAQALGEAERAIPGDDCYCWARRLVEVGENVHLRVRVVEASLDDILTFVGQGIPVAACLKDEDGDPHWLLATKLRGSSVQIESLAGGKSPKIASRSKFRQILGLRDRKATRKWVVGQAALGCEAVSLRSDYRQAGKPLTPLARTISLIRPDRSDLFAVLVFSIVVGVLALASPIAVEALVNTVAFGQYLQPVLVLAFILFVFLAFAAALRALITFVAEIVQRRIFVRVVEDLAFRLPRVQFDAYDKAHGPELVNRFFDAVTVQKTAASLLVDGVAIVLTTVIGMLVLAFYHPFLLGFDLLLLAMIAIIVFGLGNGAITSAVKESKKKYAIAAWLEELARHPTAFKLHAGQQFALDRTDQLAVDWLDARKNHFRVVLRQVLFALGLQAVASTVLLGLGGWLVIQGELTLGQLVAAELIVMMIVGSFAKLGKHMESFYDLLASVDKLGQLFDLPVEPQNKLFYLCDSSPAAVKMHDVSYKLGSEPLLKNLSLELEPGESYAVTGRPGSGKSTLVDMLCGLRNPDTGHVELDGVDFRELRPDSLREHLAAARGIEVFHGTLGENVHLNRPNLSALDVREALDAVGLLDEVLDLPDGINTMLQTNGAPLSQTQALRLMVARAIAGRPRLLLIDGTLDALSDATLDTVLPRLTADDAPWTLLVVTGRRQVMAACQHAVMLPQAETRKAPELVAQN